MDLAALLERLVRSIDLSEAEATDLMRWLMSGEADEARIAGFLVALRAKEIRAEELAAFARVLRDHAHGVRFDAPNLVDTCGTGGGPATINLSTGAAFVAAACGARVAKHGNRSFASVCGSADVLEEMGARLDTEPERLAHVLEVTGIVFLFAPLHHQAVRHVGPTRKALGIRTVFNLLGPLANPAGARRQVVGVWDETYLRPMAEALLRLGCERGAVVHGEDGLDEVSPSGPTQVIEIRDGALRELTVTPADFDMTPVTPSRLACSTTVAENAHRLQMMLAGKDADHGRALIPNAAMALLVAGEVETLREGAHLAAEAIATGAALAKLEQFLEVGATP